MGSLAFGQILAKQRWFYSETKKVENFCYYAIATQYALQGLFPTGKVPTNVAECIDFSFIPPHVIVFCLNWEIRKELYIRYDCRPTTLPVQKHYTIKNH